MLLLVTLVSAVVGQALGVVNGFSQTCKKPCPVWAGREAFICVEGGTPDGQTTFTNETEGDLNVTVTGASAAGGEFKCMFRWNEAKKQKLIKGIKDRMKERQKSFIRFTVPVLGYTNADVSMHNETTLLTWVWVLTKHNYMLHYPQNFIKTSLWAMSIITEDWALDYDNSIVPVSLQNFSFDIGDDWYEYKAGMGDCEPECIKAYNSCGIGKQELFEVVNATNKAGEWEWICLQLPYDQRIFDLTGSQPTFVFPDVVYYLLFLHKLYSERPLLGVPRKRTFIQYHCYMGHDLSQSKRREFLEKYFVIPLIACVLWLYLPLLIYYFPSSSKKTPQATQLKPPTGLFPSHKSPNYLGRWLKHVLCFHSPRNSSRLWVRVRRLLFLSLVLISSYRVSFVPHYGWLAYMIFIVMVVAMLIPMYISEHVKPDKKFSFMGGEVPTDLHVDPDAKEYQLLASVMQERVHLLFSGSFWSFVYQNLSSTFTGYPVYHLYVWFKFFVCLIFTFFNIMYYFFPLFFFVKELTAAIKRMSVAAYQQAPSFVNKVFYVLHGCLAFFALLYCMVIALSWCYGIIEVSLFTIMAGAMLPKMAFPYFVLAGSIARGLYSLVHSLHEDYENIISDITGLLSSEKKLPSNVVFGPNDVIEIVKEEDEILSSSFSVFAVVREGVKLELLRKNVVVTFLSTSLYEHVVEACHPVRKQVPFMLLQVTAMVFYAVVIMWMKNVYHLESEVSQIFTLVTTVSISFVPQLLRCFAYKSYFGLDVATARKQKVYFAMIDYIATL